MILLKYGVSYLGDFLLLFYIFNKNNKTDASNDARTTHLSGAHEFIPGFLVRFLLLNLVFAV